MLHILSGEDAEKIQSLLCVGLSKLVLAGIISDERVRFVSSDFCDVLSHTMYSIGLEEPRGGIPFPRYRRESRAETMFDILLPCVLLFVECKPESGVSGTLDWLLRLTFDFDVVCG